MAIAIACGFDSCQQPMIISAFTYFNEDMILDVHLSEMHDVIDYFVIVEGNRTFRNKPRDRKFAASKIKDKFWNKIIYSFESLEPMENPWMIEAQLRERLWRLAAKICADNDTIIFGDVDEIPNKGILETYDGGVFSLRMIQCNYFFNVQVRDDWAMTKISPWKVARQTHPDSFRRKKMPAIPNGGWHFTNIMTPEAYILKHKSFSHAECDRDDILTVENISKAMKDLVSPFGLNGNLFAPKILAADELPSSILNYPEFIWRQS